MIYPAFINAELSKRTSVFGLQLWIVIVVVLGSIIAVILFLLTLCLCRSSKHLPRSSVSAVTPAKSKEIQDEVHRKLQQPRATTQTVPSGLGSRVVIPEVRGEESDYGWGRRYTVSELEIATNGFCEERVIGVGGHGTVYRGVLHDGSSIAVKNLFNNRGQAEKEFKVEVEAIGRVRHRNLVWLLGYCVEGALRMLVYEHVENGNLEDWLHGDVPPLPWNLRLKIILGTAKALTYLHECLDPKVIHRDVKSSNILLDRHWNPKVSDFGLAKLLCSESSHVTTRVMGTFGYVSPDYACTGLLNATSDVYSFGVLMLEIICGRLPVDYSRPEGEVHLVDWVKMRDGVAGIVDPKLVDSPPKWVQRAVWAALRCVDPDPQKRPKMGQVIHMIDGDE